MSDAGSVGGGHAPSTLELGANHPIVLDSTSGWIVESGSVDVFLQRDVSGLGARHHIGTAPPGTLLWARESAVPDGWRMVGVGQPGTTARVVDDLDASVSSASLRALGRFVTVLRSETDGDAVEAVPPGASPEAALDELSAALRSALVDAVEAIDAAAAASNARLAETPEAERRDLGVALADLVTVLDQERERVASDDRLGQVVAVARRIGEELGIDITATSPDEHEDPLRAVLGAAGVRVRITYLSGEWWSRSSVAMIGFVESEDRPVALLPRRGHLLLYDPVTGRTQRVDAATAKTLASTAYLAYAPLPDDATSVGSVLRFGLTGLGRDGWLLAGLALVAGLISLITPVVVGLLFSSVLPSRNEALLIAISAMLLGAAVTGALITWSRNLALVAIDGQLQARLEPGLIGRVLRLPSSFFRDYLSGDLASRVQGAQQIRQILSGAVATSLITAAVSVMNFVVVFVYSWQLGVVAVLVVSIIGVALYALVTRSIPPLRQHFDQLAAVTSDLAMGVSAVEKIRVAAAEPRLLVRWARSFRRQQLAEIHAARLQAWIASLALGASALVMIGIYAVAGSWLKASLSSGSFLASVTALGQFTAAVSAVAFSLVQATAAVPLWDRLRPLLAEPIEDEGPRELHIVRGTVALTRVSFRYTEDAPLALDSISLQASPGEFIAITGPSGAGKSTLVRLILGLDHPSEGSVSFDGNDIGLLDVENLRQQVGVVTQDVRPLPGEILSTITSGTQASEDDAWEAAEAAAVADDIRRMPMKMRTIIGEGGIAFSGGQIQRLMIARALVRRPKVIVFDEATSALDDETQARVISSLDTLDVTRIVIAHRLSTIRRADRIYVLENGKVTQVGDFEELMRSDGTFRDLASRQMIEPTSSS